MTHLFRPLCDLLGFRATELGPASLEHLSDPWRAQGFLKLAVREGLGKITYQANGGA